MPEPDDKDDEWLPPELTLDREGKIDGIYRPHDDRRPAESWRIVPGAPEKPLELQASSVAEPPAEAEPSRRSWGLPVSPFAALLALGLLALPSLGFHYRHRLRALGSRLETRWRRALAPPPVQPARAAPAAAPRPREMVFAAQPDARPGEFVLTVESTPPGATVFIEERALGETPYIGSNGFPAGTSARVRLVLAGYQPWTGVVQGGGNVRLEARLRK